jgi:hypothetical protein
VKNIVDSLVWIIGIGLIPYTIAVLMPSWRWLLGVALVIGGPLIRSLDSRLDRRVE